MNLKKYIVPCLIVLTSGTAARACDGDGLAMAYLFGGYGGFNNQPRVFNNYTPPYFALHPPVYYGDRYYRPYGVSPFATWPQVQANPNYSPKIGQGLSRSSVIIVNPHVQAVLPSAQSQPESGSAPVQKQVASPNIVQKYSGPLIIDNPYYIESESNIASAQSW